MDKRVFIILLGLIVLIGAVLGIKMMLSDRCETPVIMFEPAVPQVGKAVKFTCNAEENVKWYFPGGKTSSDKETTYSFDSAGTFTVKIIVNEKEQCADEKIVTVVPVPVPHEAAFAITPPPKIIRVKEQVTFTDATPGATGWDWKVTQQYGSGKPVEIAKGQGSSFDVTFSNPGKYKMSLSVMGELVKGDTSFDVIVKGVVIPPDDPYKFKDTKVKDPPPPPKDGRPCAKKMADADFRNKFIEAANDFLSDDKSTQNAASKKWAENIAPCGIDETMTVEIISEGGSRFKPLALEDFKKNILYDQYNSVKDVSIISRSGSCITIIRAVVVEKN